MAAKHTRILIEQETLMLIPRSNSDRVWCAVCQANVTTIESQQIVLALPALLVQRCLQNGTLHTVSSDCTTRMCLDSLLRCFESQAKSTFDKENL